MSNIFDKIEIPKKLKVEFQTVELILDSNAQTKGLDALLLSWAKYEKQHRKLFEFLVYQSPAITCSNWKEFQLVWVGNKHLYPKHFRCAIKQLTNTRIKTLVGTRYVELQTSLDQIEKYRNKLLHGQLTGEGLGSSNLLQSTKDVIDWVSLLADGSETAFSYDGLDRR